MLVAITMESVPKKDIVNTLKRRVECCRADREGCKTCVLLEASAGKAFENYL